MKDIPYVVLIQSPLPLFSDLEAEKKLKMPLKAICIKR